VADVARHAVSQTAALVGGSTGAVGRDGHRLRRSDRGDQVLAVLLVGAMKTDCVIKLDPATLGQWKGDDELTMNRSLNAAKAAKQDEYYTQYVDIQNEVESYFDFAPNTFSNEVVYCNCDDPFESKFFKYFAINFN